MSTPEEEARRRILGQGESANYGQELLAQAQNMDPAEARKMLEATGFGVARPPTPEEIAARNQSRQYPANAAPGFTPPPPVNQPDMTRPVDQQPASRPRTRGELKRAGGGKEPRNPNVMSSGDVFRASMQGPEFREGGMSAGDVYRASVGANREPAPTAQEIYGDVDIPGTIARGISSFLNPPPRDPGATRGGQRARAADEPAPQGSRGQPSPEPTGSQPVPTQGQAPVADATTQAENVDPTRRRELLTPENTTPEMREAQREMFRDGTLAGVTLDSSGPGGIERLYSRPGDEFGVDEQGNQNFFLTPPQSSQAVDQAEPGQQSAPESGVPEGGLDRVRIHRMMGRNAGVTDAIINSPDPTRGGLAGLEGPAGLSDQDLVKFARLKAQGIEGNDAQNLLQLQRRVDAEITRANAGMINARSRAFFPFKTAQGTVIAQVDENGDIGFVETDLQELLEPRVGNVVNDNGITRTSTPTLLYPVYDGYGNPTGAVGGFDVSAYMGPDPNSERAISVQNFIDMALQQGATPQEIQEQLDMRFGFAEEPEE